VRKRIPALFLIAIGFFGAGTVAAQGIDFGTTEFNIQKLTQSFYVLTGSPGTDPGHLEAAGATIGVLTGPDGVLLVDAGYKPLTEKIVAAIAKFAPGPIRFLVDTHEHPDHTGGNPNFARMGVLVIAREEVREELEKPLPAAVGEAASGTDPARLPVLTFGAHSPMKIHFDAETIDLIPLPAAHTNGDALIRFEKADIIMVGDIYRNFGYPFVDTSRGGSFKGLLEALAALETLAGPDTQLIPGHGTMIKRADIVPYRDMIVSISNKVATMVREGKNKQEVLAENLVAPYDAKVPELR
jgi:cyclase